MVFMIFLSVISCFRCWTSINIFVGVTMMITLSSVASWYLGMLHENMLWFTNIRELEREISFRTEQGLYYSYFKEIINNPNYFNGILDLTQDNTTEHGHTINIIQRFNIYQEIILAALYRILGLQKLFAPSLFYINSIFILQGLYFGSIFMTSWILGKSWIAGVLSVCLLICNLNDATRVHHAVPLRESFALPFVFCQMLAVSLVLKGNHSKRKEVLFYFILAFLTLCYQLFWQFGQFISLLQTVALFGLAVLHAVPAKKVISLLVIHAICLLLVCGLQFGNTMILISLVISFIPSAILILLFMKGPAYGIFRNMVLVVVQIVLVIILTATLNMVFRNILSFESDQHILKFLKGKFGIEDSRDFESQLYLCNDAFSWLDFESYQRLTHGLLLPLFGLVEFVGFASLAYQSLAIWDCKKDEHQVIFKATKNAPLYYHIVHSMLYLCMAVSTLRMKCFWVPHMCIVVSVGVVHKETWKTLMHWIVQEVKLLRHAAAVAIIGILIYKFLPPLIENLQELNEFWDPDTIELMKWIRKSVPKTAVFAGSMQLMAGVKLCTGHPIANHPHFEDKWLRDRTKLVYQIYSREQPSKVHETLNTIGVDYIILEDSICLAKSNGKCKLIDILDLYNGHVPENGQLLPGLVIPAHERFCRQIRYLEPSYTKYFLLAFNNKTFRVFRVL